MSWTDSINSDGSIDGQEGEYAPRPFNRGALDATRIGLVGFDGEKAIFTKWLVSAPRDMTDGEIAEVIATVTAGGDPGGDITVEEDVSAEYDSPLDFRMPGGLSVRLAIHLDVPDWVYDTGKVPFTLKQPDPDEQFFDLAVLPDAEGRSRTLRFQNMNSVTASFGFNLHVLAADADGGTSALAVTVDPSIRNDGGHP